MKKVVLLLGIVAITLGMTSCNSSKSDPTWVYMGSLEMRSGFKNVIIAADGTTLEAETGYTAFPSPAGSLHRQLCQVYFSYDEGNFNGSGPGEKLPVRLLNNVQTFPTREISSYNESEELKGDPIVSLVNFDSDNKFMLVTNFLVFAPEAHYYSVKDQLPDWSYYVEVESELTGEKSDEINLWLDFRINKSSDSDKKQSPVYTINAIDLDYIGSFVSGFDKEKTYTLKLNYQAYSDNSYDDNKVEVKTAEFEWTPSQDPYNQI